MNRLAGTKLGLRRGPMHARVAAHLPLAGWYNVEAASKRKAAARRPVVESVTLALIFFVFGWGFASFFLLPAPLPVVAVFSIQAAFFLTSFRMRTRVAGKMAWVPGALLAPDSSGTSRQHPQLLGELFLAGMRGRDLGRLIAGESLRSAPSIVALVALVLLGAGGFVVWRFASEQPIAWVAFAFAAVAIAWLAAWAIELPELFAPNPKTLREGLTAHLRQKVDYVGMQAIKVLKAIGIIIVSLFFVSFVILILGSIMVELTIETYAIDGAEAVTWVLSIVIIVLSLSIILWLHSRRRAVWLRRTRRYLRSLESLDEPVEWYVRAQVFEDPDWYRWEKLDFQPKY